MSKVLRRGASQSGHVHNGENHEILHEHCAAPIVVVSRPRTPASKRHKTKPKKANDNAITTQALGPALNMGVSENRGP